MCSRDIKDSPFKGRAVLVVEAAMLGATVCCCCERVLVHAGVGTA